MEHGNIEGLIPFQGFLKEFPILETAELPVAMLFGWNKENASPLADLVPSTLQKLCLRQDMENVADNQWNMDYRTRLQGLIDEFLPCADYMAPHLNAITIRSISMFPSEDLSCVLPCRKLCKKLGLDIEITQISDYLSPGLWTIQ